VFTGSELVVDCALYFGRKEQSGWPTSTLMVCRPYETCRSGDWAKAREIQERLVRLFDITLVPTRSRKAELFGLGGFKTALMLRGVIAHNVMGSRKSTRRRRGRCRRAVLVREACYKDPRSEPVGGSRLLEDALVGASIWASTSFTAGARLRRVNTSRRSS